jgi:SAM-dependent methyltransferase
MKKILKKFLGIDEFVKRLDAGIVRDALVQSELKTIRKKAVLLDAGCGNQKYKSHCAHLLYKTQDLGEYVRDEKENISKSSAPDYEIGSLDYKGNVWEINEKDGYFDAILCTEVFEHIPYPVEALNEFSRLLKSKGKLIITFPSASNRHFDPYYYYSGFSDRWINYFFGGCGFENIRITPIGDYYSYVLINMYSIAINSSWAAKIFLAPGIYFLSKMKKTPGSINYQCNGYFVTATKK